LPASPKKSGVAITVMPPISSRPAPRATGRRNPFAGLPQSGKDTAASPRFELNSRGLCKADEIKLGSAKRRGHRLVALYRRSPFWSFYPRSTAMLEAGVGIEPAYTDLQSAAWPLCHPAETCRPGSGSCAATRDRVRGGGPENGARLFPAAVMWPATKRGSDVLPREDRWSGKRGSNSRPQPWQGCALPTELFPHRNSRV
jgi:hypothetical protein